MLVILFAMIVTVLLPFAFWIALLSITYPTRTIPPIHSMLQRRQQQSPLRVAFSHPTAALVIAWAVWGCFEPLISHFGLIPSLEYVSFLDLPLLFAILQSGFSHYALAIILPATLAMHFTSRLNNDRLRSVTSPGSIVESPDFWAPFLIRALSCAIVTATPFVVNALLAHYNPDAISHVPADTQSTYSLIYFPPLAAASFAFSSMLKSFLRNRLLVAFLQYAAFVTGLIVFLWVLCEPWDSIPPKLSAGFDTMRIFLFFNVSILVFILLCAAATYRLNALGFQPTSLKAIARRIFSRPLPSTLHP